MENFDFEKDSKSSEEPADVSETVNEEMKSVHCIFQ